MSPVIRAVDLFCGAGGASTGFIRACEERGLDYFLIAINHWDTAILTHATNHPLRCHRCGWSTTAYPSPTVCPNCHTAKHFRGVKHLCMAVDQVNPLTEVPGGRLHLLIAGPECTHHSMARGGRPINDQSRATAWHILKWEQELYIDTLLIENVPEFKTWGPLGANGRPLKKRKGETYRAFLDALRSLGNKVDARIINTADHGDPTTRRRLFIMARRGRHQLNWPVATHSPTGERTLFGKTKKWRGAREIIDWNLKGKSIFNRSKPLSDKTMERILAGLEKFGGPQLQPFLVVLRQNMGARSLDAPVPTLAAQGNHMGLCEFVLGQQSNSAPRSTDKPLPTIAAAGKISHVEAFVLGQQGGGALRPVDEPLPTIATAGFIRVGEAFLVPFYGERKGQEPRTHAVSEPVPTIPATGGGKFGVAEPFIVANNSNNAPKSVDSPVPAITTGNRNYLAEPFILNTSHGQRLHDANKPLPTITTARGGELGVVEPVLMHTTHGGRAHSIDKPTPTVTGAHRGELGLAEPYITKYNGTAVSAYSVDEPLDTVSTRDRFGLVQPVIDGYALDIRFRMLQPHELAAATSFPKSYVFKGTREDIVKQIGNAWPGETATALCRAVLQDFASARPRRVEAVA